MVKMFSNRENSLKKDMATLHGDLGQILKRVEETGKEMDKHALEMKELTELMKSAH